MCMPYLGKLFGGGRGDRRRNNAIATPRSSLAPTPQQSNASIQTNINHNNNNNMTAAVVKKDSVAPMDIAVADNVHGSMRSNVSPVQAAGPAPTAATSDVVDTEARPSTWLEYFGYNRNKKGVVNPPDASN
ncbi:uncharacterized protein LOC133847840 [Drosophila sulfurigaster albostrigata]|uniref:uncharacterized protein LOC133847840 n=1 Tax=Drosophila sulfurigaster albostrigata TaxID=89887 RepID=UPI002D21885A|nr:uncharacterized protein LOC133847840 [Drosophila sulfurigaster albostrigata]